MADTGLRSLLDSERATAVRTLLRHPLLDAEAGADNFRLVVRHREWLAEWFETSCGWALVVDVAAGFARLGKRSTEIDDRHPLLRARGSGGAFDRRRYQLLCLVAAELVRHPMTTVGLLAGAVAAESSLDTSRHGERAAFVDALRALMAWGALESAAGDVDAFVEHERGNALLTADTARLHRLLSSATSASSLPLDVGVDAAMEALLAEPRYGSVPGDAGDLDEQQRLRWVRHSLGRRVLDSPVLHLDEGTEAERTYLANPAGRAWVRDRVAAAGFELEERQEGLLAVDPDAIATDRLFPAPQGNVHQLALLLVDHLLDREVDGGRTPVRRTRQELLVEVDGLLSRYSSWARAHRDDGGPERLLDDAVHLLVDLGLARRQDDGSVVGRPALARYRAADPLVSEQPANLFVEMP